MTAHSVVTSIKMTYIMSTIKDRLFQAQLQQNVQSHLKLVPSVWKRTYYLSMHGSLKASPPAPRCNAESFPPMLNAPPLPPTPYHNNLSRLLEGTIRETGCLTSEGGLLPSAATARKEPQAYLCPHRNPQVSGLAF